MQQLKKANRVYRLLDYQKTSTMRYKQPAITTVAEFKNVARRILGDKGHAFANYENRRFFTFGSCFANNIAAYLTAKGAHAKTSMLTEDINAPFNNLILIKRTLLGEPHPIADELERVVGVKFDDMRTDLLDATDIVFTLGNIFRLYVGEKHVLHPTLDATLRAESLEETKECISGVISLLLARTRAKLYITVSPVPISGYRGTQYVSAFEADCASKCQLRTAIGSIGGDFTYLPIFEVIKWLAPHQEFASFGKEDGNSRHLNRELVRAVMECLT